MKGKVCGESEVLKWVKRLNTADKKIVLVVNNQVQTRGNRFQLDQFRFRREIGING